MLELDCHLTLDGHVVVSHDENLLRQTGHNVSVSSLRLQVRGRIRTRILQTFCHLHQFYPTVQKSCFQSQYLLSTKMSEATAPAGRSFSDLTNPCFVKNWLLWCHLFHCSLSTRFIRALSILSTQISLNSWMFHWWSYFCGCIIHLLFISCRTCLCIRRD